MKIYVDEKDEQSIRKLTAACNAGLKLKLSASPSPAQCGSKIVTPSATSSTSYSISASPSVGPYECKIFNHKEEKELKKQLKDILVYRYYGTRYECDKIPLKINDIIRLFDVTIERLKI